MTTKAIFHSGDFPFFTFAQHRPIAFEKAASRDSHSFSAFSLNIAISVREGWGGAVVKVQEKAHAVNVIIHRGSTNSARRAGLFMQ